MFLSFVLSNDHVFAVVMAMIIAYQTLNKIGYPQDTRFTDACVIIIPGITIKDRLNVLKPQEYRNYYKERDIVSPSDLELLQHANVFITNFHKLELRQNQRFQVSSVLKASGLIKDEVVKEIWNMILLPGLLIQI